MVVHEIGLSTHNTAAILRQRTTDPDDGRPGDAHHREIDLTHSCPPVAFAGAEDILDHHAALPVVAHDKERAIVLLLLNFDLDSTATLR
jgi:hypothetical protein